MATAGPTACPPPHDSTRGSPLGLGWGSQLLTLRGGVGAPAPGPLHRNAVHVLPTGCLGGQTGGPVVGVVGPPCWAGVVTWGLSDKPATQKAGAASLDPHHHHPLPPAHRHLCRPERPPPHHHPCPHCPAQSLPLASRASWLPLAVPSRSLSPTGHPGAAPPGCLHAWRACPASGHVWCPPSRPCCSSSIRKAPPPALWQTWSP